MCVRRCTAGQERIPTLLREILILSRWEEEGMSAPFVYILKLFQVKQNQVSLSFDSSHAAVSWVCGWMLNCTEEPPPNAPHLTTNHCPPSRTSTSTVWRFGPSSSPTYSHICRQCLNTLPSIIRLEANVATPHQHSLICERKRY